jgi:hypothetical protein
MLIDNAHGPSTLPDTLPHGIIYLLSSQATLTLANPHGACCPLGNSNTGVIGLGADVKCWRLDCIRICDERFRQYKGITLLYTF